MVDGEAMVGKTLVGDAMFGSLRWSKSGMLFLRGPSDVEGQFPLSAVLDKGGRYRCFP